MTSEDDYGSLSTFQSLIDDNEMRMVGWLEATNKDAELEVFHFNSLPVVTFTALPALLPVFTR
jgi:hypothetical protein